MPRPRRQLDLFSMPPRTSRKHQRRSGRLTDAGNDGYRRYTCQWCEQEFTVWVDEAEQRLRLVLTRPCPDCDPEVS